MHGDRSPVMDSYSSSKSFERSVWHREGVSMTRFEDVLTWTRQRNGGMRQSLQKCFEEASCPFENVSKKPAVSSLAVNHPLAWTGSIFLGAWLQIFAISLYVCDACVIAIYRWSNENLNKKPLTNTKSQMPSNWRYPWALRSLGCMAFESLGLPFYLSEMG